MYASISHGQHFSNTRSCSGPAPFSSAPLRATTNAQWLRVQAAALTAPPVPRRSNSPSNNNSVNSTGSQHAPAKPEPQFTIKRTHRKHQTRQPAPHMCVHLSSEQQQQQQGHQQGQEPDHTLQPQQQEQQAPVASKLSMSDVRHLLKEHHAGRSWSHLCDVLAAYGAQLPAESLPALLFCAHHLNSASLPQSSRDLQSGLGKEGGKKGDLPAHETIAWEDVPPQSLQASAAATLLVKEDGEAGGGNAAGGDAPSPNSTGTPGTQANSNVSLGTTHVNGKATKAKRAGDSKLPPQKGQDPVFLALLGALGAKAEGTVVRDVDSSPAVSFISLPMYEYLEACQEHESDILAALEQGKSSRKGKGGRGSSAAKQGDTAAQAVGTTGAAGNGKEAAGGAVAHRPALSTSSNRASGFAVEQAAATQLLAQLLLRHVDELSSDVAALGAWVLASLLPPGSRPTSATVPAGAQQPAGAGGGVAESQLQQCIVRLLLHTLGVAPVEACTLPEQQPARKRPEPEVLLTISSAVMAAAQSIRGQGNSNSSGLPSILLGTTSTAPALLLPDVWWDELIDQCMFKGQKSLEPYEATVANNKKMGARGQPKGPGVVRQVRIKAALPAAVLVACAANGKQVQEPWSLDTQTSSQGGLLVRNTAPAPPSPSTHASSATSATSSDTASSNKQGGKRKAKGKQGSSTSSNSEDTRWGSSPKYISIGEGGNGWALQVAELVGSVAPMLTSQQLLDVLWALSAIGLFPMAPKPAPPAPSHQHPAWQQGQPGSVQGQLRQRGSYSLHSQPPLEGVMLATAQPSSPLTSPATSSPVAASAAESAGSAIRSSRVAGPLNPSLFLEPTPALQQQPTRRVVPSLEEGQETNDGKDPLLNVLGDRLAHSPIQRPADEDIDAEDEDASDSSGPVLSIDSAPGSVQVDGSIPGTSYGASGEQSGLDTCHFVTDHPPWLSALLAETMQQHRLQAMPGAQLVSLLRALARARVRPHGTQMAPFMHHLRRAAPALEAPQISAACAALARLRTAVSSQCLWALLTSYQEQLEQGFSVGRAMVNKSTTTGNKGWPSLHCSARLVWALPYISRNYTTDLLRKQRPLLRTITRLTHRHLRSTAANAPNEVREAEEVGLQPTSSTSHTTVTTSLTTDGMQPSGRQDFKSVHPRELVQLAEGFMRLKYYPGAEWMRDHRAACIALQPHFTPGQLRRLRIAYQMLLDM